MNSIKQRYDFVDMAKGYGMLFIMIGHLGITKLHDLFYFQVWIYSFHIPLFFFLSGFLFKPDVTVKRFALSKLRSIVIPYFCTGLLIIVYEIYHAACLSKLTWEFVGEQFRLLLVQRRTWTIWFLAALLICNIIAFALKKLLKKDLFVFIACVLIASGGLLYYHFGGDKLPWDVDVALPAMVFFIVGYLVKKHIGSFQKIFYNKKITVIAFAICLIISIATSRAHYEVTRVITDMFGMKYGNAPLFYFCAFSGIAAVVLFSTLFTIQPFHYIGANSLTYFAFHQTIVLPLTYSALAAAHITINNDTQWWVMILYWLMVLVIINLRLTVWNVALTHSPFGFIIGKRRKKAPKAEAPEPEAPEAAANTPDAEPEPALTEAPPV